MTTQTTDWLQYIRWDGFEKARSKEKEGERHKYAASKQLRKVKPGDRIWTVTQHRNKKQRSHSNELILCGVLYVGEVTDDKERAEQFLGFKPWEHEDSPGNEVHALSEPGTEALFKEVNVTDLEPVLLFDGPTKRLDPSTPVGQQLQQLRRLSSGSAELFKQRWLSAPPTVSRSGYVQHTPEDHPLDDDENYLEGRVVLRQHKERERNKVLVVRAKELSKARDGGKLLCEVCRFDFAAQYGALGDGFIEAHHRLPISQLDTQTVARPEDLAMVCSNCHRMIHRRQPWLSVEELQRIVKSAN